MKILLIDDHRLVADAMAIMLQDLANDVEVTVCHTTQRALSMIDDGLDFELILTDMFMPGIDGLGLLHGLRSRKVEAPAVVVSSTEDKKIVQAALDQGAAGFIRKSLPGSEMLRALRGIVAGNAYYPDDISPGIRKASPAQQPIAISETDADAIVVLGDRQTEVLELMAAGNSNKQIAQLLGISEATVKYHTSQLFKLLGVKNRTSCIREGHRRNLISDAPIS